MIPESNPKSTLGEPKPMLNVPAPALPNMDPTLHPAYYRHGMIQSCLVSDPRPGAMPNTGNPTEAEAGAEISASLYVANTAITQSGFTVSFCRMSLRSPGEESVTNFFPVLGPSADDFKEIADNCAKTATGLQTYLPKRTVMFLLNLGEAQLATEYMSGQNIGSTSLYALCRAGAHIRSEAHRKEAEDELQKFFKKLKALYRKQDLS